LGTNSFESFWKKEIELTYGCANALASGVLWFAGKVFRNSYASIAKQN
jgi:hypothetical protein